MYIPRGALFKEIYWLRPYDLFDPPGALKVCCGVVILDIAPVGFKPMSFLVDYLCY
jgi:hypothetical protein